MSFEKYPPCCDQRTPNGVFLWSFNSSKHNTTGDEIDEVEHYVERQQERTSSHPQNLPYMSALLVEHDLPLFVGYLRRVKSHCHSQHSARRRRFERSTRFDLLPWVYEVLMLSSVYMIRDHTWWLPYLWCLTCDLIALVLYFTIKRILALYFMKTSPVI